MSSSEEPPSPKSSVLRLPASASTAPQKPSIAPLALHPTGSQALVSPTELSPTPVPSRASSTTLPPDLALAPYSLSTSSRKSDRFSISSESEDETRYGASHHEHGRNAIQRASGGEDKHDNEDAESRYPEGSDTGIRNARKASGPNWFKTPPRTPQTAGEFPMAEVITPAAGSRAAHSGSSTRGMISPREVRTSVSTSSRKGSGSTGPERRGSEAKSWAEIYEARALAAQSQHYPDKEDEHPITRTTIERYPSTSTRAMKSPSSPYPEDELRTPTTVASLKTVATASTSAKAERALHVPFLPKFLGLAASKAATEYPRDSSQDEQRGKSSDAGVQKDVETKQWHEERGEAQALQSVFESNTSEDEDPAEVGEAKTARSGSPKMVTRNPKERKFNLKEMLLSEAPSTSSATTPTSRNPGTPRKKIASFLGESVKFGSKREGVVGMSEPDTEYHAPSPKTMKSIRASEVGVAISPGLNSSSGARSEPARRAKTTPGRAKRRVTFPPPIEIGPEQREVRPSIVSTPYPLGHPKAGEQQQSWEKLGKTKDILTLVLQSAEGPPEIRRIVIPGPQETVMVDDSEGKKPMAMATLRKDFDDEALFKLLKAEFKTMRGVSRRFASARRSRGIVLLPYRDMSDLGKHSGLAYRNRAFGAEEDFLLEARLLHLFRNPKLGRRKHQWTEWVSRLPGNTKAVSDHSDNVAIELVQSWSVAGITLATTLVLVLSLAATLLWIFLGKENTSVVSFAPIDPDQSLGSGVDSSIYRDRGDRVVTGVAIGVLVLLFGWVGVGAWVLLSWLAG
ncbi:MAG: hypothetical protein Q9191_002259 [Dirinaria sp. TL-2023a]